MGSLAAEMRLAKYMAHAGVASRRAAERMIADGRVAVGGKRVTDPARDVGEQDDVRVDGSPLTTEPLEYFLLHKPIGVLSTANDPQGRPTVTELVDSDARLYPVGRLDADSSGLVLLTNDGELANRLMHPRYEVPRTYRVKVSGSPSKRALQELREGVELEDGHTRPARIRVVAGGRESVVDITIHEGRNRIVRRTPWSGGSRGGAGAGGRGRVLAIGQAGGAVRGPPASRVLVGDAAPRPGRPSTR